MQSEVREEETHRKTWLSSEREDFGGRETGTFYDTHTGDETEETIRRKSDSGSGRGHAASRLQGQQITTSAGQR